MPSQVATAYVQIIPSAQGIGGGIAQALGGDAAATSAGQSFGGKLVGAIKGVIAAAGIGTALSKAITEGAALEQSIGGVETLFGDAASQVIAAADNAFATAGLSANQYMETVTGFSARLLQGLGGDTQAAAALADTAVTDMADNANKMGTSMETITQTYQSLARGNYEMLDNLKLGYGGTQSEMARLINDSGVLGDTMVATAENVNSIGFDKMIEAIHAVQVEMEITGTAADEGVKTISGSLNALKASFSNVLANLTLGRDLGPSLNALATTLTTFLTGNLLPAVWNILSALPGALVTFVTSIGPQLVSGLQTMVPQILTSGTQLIQSLGDGFVQGIPEFLANALPMVLQFTEQLRANFGTMVDAGIDLLLNLVQGIADALPTLIEYVPQIITNIAGLINDNAPKLLSAGLQIIVTIGKGIIQAIPKFLANALPMVLQFTEQLRANFGTMVDAGIDLLLNLVQGIADALPTLIEYVPQIITNIAGLINDNAPKLLSAGLQIIVTIGKGIIQAIPTIIANIPQIIQAIVSVFTAFNWINLGSNIITMLKNGITSMVGAVQSAGTSIFDAVKNAITNLPSVLKNIGSNAIQSLAGGIRALAYDAQMAGVSVFSAIRTALAGLPSTLLTLGKNAISSMAGGLRNMLGNVVSAAQSILSGIVGAIKALPGKLLSLAVEAAKKMWDAFIVNDWNGLGSNIIQGIINGIGAMGGALWDAANNIAKSAFNAIKSFFGIASPSKLMQFEIGPYIPQGLALGIEKNANFVTDAMDDLSARSYASMRTALTSGAPGASTAPARPGLYGTADTAALLQECVDLLRLILEAVYGIHIGDEEIGRANARYQASRAIMLGGTV